MREKWQQVQRMSQSVGDNKEKEEKKGPLDLCIQPDKPKNGSKVDLIFLNIPGAIKV